MNADAIIETRFKTSAEGGRNEPISIRDIPYGCPVFVGREAFDCRFMVENRTFELGQTYDIPVKFLRADLVLPLLALGTPVILWEGKEIATGKIVRLMNASVDL